MGFKAYGATKSEGSAKKDIDYDAYNKYIVETCQLEERETLVGYISNIVDLGMQEQPDAEFEFKGDADDEEAEIKKNPGTYFKNGIDPVSKKKVRLKCWKQKPQQSIAIAVDFPDIMLDRGQFFGSSKELPLRMWLGGNFFIEGAGQIVARPTPLKVTKNSEGKWSFAPNHLLYKMAIDSKIIKPGEVFKPEQIDQLLGESFQFSVQVYMKEVNGKSYLTEYIKYVGGLGRKQEPAEHLTPLNLIEFDSDNSEDAIKELRNHVVNTIKRASNYKGSKIEEQINRLKGSTASTSDSSDEDDSQDQDNTPEPTKAPVAAPKEKASRKAKDAPVANTVADIPDDNLDDPEGDCPF